jgi:hypothetical protein
LLAGCALEDEFEDRYTTGYVVPQTQLQGPVGASYQPGSACANRAGVIPAAYSPPPPTNEPPR